MTAPTWRVACDPAGKRGIVGLLHALGRLHVAGASLRPGRLTDGRSTRRLDLEQFTPIASPGAVDETETETALSPTTWLVNGNRARPAFGPEKPRFGPGPALEIPPAAVEPTPMAYPNGWHDPSANHMAHGPAPNVDPEIDGVFAEYQRSMRKFLEIQQNTMLALLGHAESPAPAASPSPSPSIEIESRAVAHRTRRSRVAVLDL